MELLKSTLAVLMVICGVFHNIVPNSTTIFTITGRPEVSKINFKKKLHHLLDLRMCQPHALMNLNYSACLCVFSYRPSDLRKSENLVIFKKSKSQQNY